MTLPRWPDDCEIYSPEASDGRRDWPSIIGNAVLWILGTMLLVGVLALLA